MKLAEIVKYLDNKVPLHYQESYDNSGLLIGDKDMEVKSVLTCLDCTEDVIKEAIQQKSNLIISHHPILFRPIKKITSSNYVQRIIFKAIKNNIAIYALHTNLDNIEGGVSFIFSNKLGLLNSQILKQKDAVLSKLVTYCPTKYLSKIQTALFDIGAGKIGSKYDQCSFVSDGLGTFRPLSGSNPYIGSENKRTSQSEDKLELIFPTHLQKRVIKTLFEAHPYEEVAYDIIHLENQDNSVGSGIIGELNKEMDIISFFKLLKKEFPYQMLKYTKFSNIKKVKKIAFCGGSGAFLINEAMKQGADIYISSDFKYHDFFDANEKIIIVDIGHYETEQFVAEQIYQIVKKKFHKLDVVLTKVNTNPISYY